MITFPMLPGVDINIFLLIFIGFGAGILSGFAGVGGAFVVTPALIVLGFPANFAVGTSLAWVVGNSVIAALGHRRLGNVDMKLGLVILVASISGMEVGVRILNWARNIGLADEVVLSISICMLLIVGTYTLLEGIRRKRELDKILTKKEKLPPIMRGTPLSQKLQSINMPPMLHFAKSGVTISPWIILAIGFFIGMLAGLIGVGGGFIMMPSLVYLIGLRSFMAVGTDLFQIIFSAAYGSIRHTMSGNVIIFAAFIMVVASSIGVRFGVLVTRYVRGVSVRIILGISILLFAAGAILKLSSILLEKAITWLEIGSLAVTFGSMGLTVIMILALYLAAYRYRSGKHVPMWVESLVAKED
ncbi:hypothetical protein ES703_121820 [subsurface metagenome]